MSHKVEHIAGKLLGKLGVDINQQRRDYGHQQPMYAPPPIPPPHLINAQYQGQHQPTGVVPGFEPEPHLLSVSPLPPPRVNTATRPSPALPLTQPSQHRAGVIYAPGTYPTPELFPFPLGNHTVLSNPSSYTCRAIQDALDALGPQSTLYLPKRSRWAVSKTIFLKPYQEIATEGYPTNGEEMAWLDATEELEKHLLSGFCVAGVRIRNIGVDGGREKFGYKKTCDCLVHLGGDHGPGKIGENQAIDHCIIQHPRQWSCFQAFEGGQNIRVTNNFIGPAGHDAYSGPDGQWADGISYAASNGLVAGNQIMDATDGGIVIFGAPGTLVTSNTIITRSRVGLGAINMVDYGPLKDNGNYEYTRVLHNTILIQGAMLKLGIGQGYSCWFGTPSDQPRKYLRGAIVMNNLIDSPEGQGQVGYGFAVTDVENWTCIGNVSGEGVKYDGVATDPPRGGRLKVSPGAFVRSPSTKDGTTGPKGHSNLQSNFVVGNVYSLIGVQPGHSDVRSFSAGQLCLRPGEKITLREIELEFSTDGEVKLVRPFDGTPTWVFNQPYHSVGPNTRLMFMENGKFGIVEAGGRLVVDLTPNLPFSGIHDLPDEPNAKATLTLFGNGGGRLSIMSPNGSLILSAPPFVTTHNYELKPYPSAPFISHPSAHGQSTIVTLLSPFGRLVVLETVGGPEMDLPIRFGQKVGEGGQIPVEARWKVIWSSKEPRKEQVDENGRDEHAKLCFQGDGNLVVYSSKAGPVWSSGTHAVKPVLKWMKFGCGIESDPCIELCDETGKVGWKV